MSTSGLFFRQRRWRPSSFPFPLFFSSYSFLGNTFSNHRQIDLYIINIVNLTPKWSNQEASQTKSSTTNKQRHLRQKTRVNVCDTIFMHYYQMDVVDVAGFITKWTLSTLQALSSNEHCRLCCRYYQMNVVDNTGQVFQGFTKIKSIENNSNNTGSGFEQKSGLRRRRKKETDIKWNWTRKSIILFTLSLSLSLSLTH